ncbi:MAG: DUF4834 family protein [Prevotella sp.]|nr:DUF4834 family protein [Prevotella sp.]
MILRFLLISFLLVVVVGVFFLSFVVKRFKQVTQQFRQTTAERPKGDRQTVEDRRTPNEANKKIIPKDEGEYVDFEEEV